MFVWVSTCVSVYVKFSLFIRVDCVSFTLFIISQVLLEKLVFSVTSLLIVSLSQGKPHKWQELHHVLQYLEGHVALLTVYKISLSFSVVYFL